MGRWALAALPAAALAVAAITAWGLVVRSSSMELAIMAGATAVAVLSGGAAACRSRRRATAAATTGASGAAGVGPDGATVAGPTPAAGASEEQQHTFSLVSPWDPPGVVDLTGASPEEVRRGVAAGERALIEQLVNDGTLSGGGPLSDADVGTLVFVAVSSGELLGALLDPDEARSTDDRG